MATSGHPDMQVSPRISCARYAFQAGHEGSIPFARSNQKHQVNGHHRTLAGSQPAGVSRFGPRIADARAAPARR